MADGRSEARRRRLSRSGDFDRVYREGDSRGNRFLVLYAFARAEAGRGDGPRLGVSVGRKLGGAVQRNRVKRALREAFWALADQLPPEHDFVIVARPGAEELIKNEGKGAIEQSLRELAADAFPDGERKT
jgi:ribonuclease P protein component